MFYVHRENNLDYNNSYSITKYIGVEPCAGRMRDEGEASGLEQPEDSWQVSERCEE